MKDEPVILVNKLYVCYFPKKCKYYLFHKRNYSHDFNKNIDYECDKCSDKCKGYYVKNCEQIYFDIIENRNVALLNLRNDSLFIRKLASYIIQNTKVEYSL